MANKKVPPSKDSRGYGYGTFSDVNVDWRFNKDNKPKSKYMRDPAEKKTSKYMRDPGEEKRSKYARDPYEVKQHHYNLARNYREEEPSELTEDEIIENEELAEEEAKELSAEETVSEESVSDVKDSNDDAVAVEETAGEIDSDFEAEEESVAFDETEAAKEKAKGDITAVFKHSGQSMETTVAHIENEEEQRKTIIIKTIVVISALTVIAAILQLFPFKSSFMPSGLTVDFASFPELIVSLAYGPVLGIVSVVIKNVIYIILRLVLMQNYSIATILSNIILDSLFITFSGWFYSKRIFSVNPKNAFSTTSKDRRRSSIFIGGIIAAVITTAVSFFLTNYVSYRIIYWQTGYTPQTIINMYQEALNHLNTAFPETFSSPIKRIDSVKQGILFYNVPITLTKYVLTAAVSSIVYVFISPYIHFRKKSEK